VNKKGENYVKNTNKEDPTKKEEGKEEEDDAVQSKWSLK